MERTVSFPAPCIGVPKVELLRLPDQGVQGLVQRRKAFQRGRQIELPSAKIFTRVSLWTQLWPFKSAEQIQYDTGEEWCREGSQERGHGGGGGVGRVPVACEEKKKGGWVRQENTCACVCMAEWLVLPRAVVVVLRNARRTACTDARGGTGRLLKGPTHRRAP